MCNTPLITFQDKYFKYGVHEDLMEWGLKLLEVEDLIYRGFLICVLASSWKEPKHISTTCIILDITEMIE